MTKASFNKIRQQIIGEIDGSEHSIDVAVAWFTSLELLEHLCDALQRGCKVAILLSDHVENSKLSFGKFIRLGGSVSTVSSLSGRFLHDKFAIFDNSKLVAGSYNWTNSAEYYNHEYIIASSDRGLLRQFGIRFRSLSGLSQPYSRQSLLTQAALCAETKEDEFILLEEELSRRFLETVEIANKSGARVNEKLVQNYLYTHGAVRGAARLINAGTEIMHSGLIKLFEINRLDLSFEHIIQEDRFRGLFDATTLQKASERLAVLKKN